MRPSWSASSLILRLRFTSRPGSAVTSWLGCTEFSGSEEVRIGNIRLGIMMVVRHFCLEFLFEGGKTVSLGVVDCTWHFWLSGPEGFLITTLTQLCLTFP